MLRGSAGGGRIFIFFFGGRFYGGGARGRAHGGSHGGGGSVSSHGFDVAEAAVRAWSPEETLVLVAAAMAAVTAASTAASCSACDMDIRMSPMAACGGRSGSSVNYPTGKVGSHASFRFS